MEENINLETAEQGQEEEKKTYTEEEVMSLLQKESDRRVSSALKKQAKDYEKKLSLSKLDEQERATAEKDMRIQELTEKLAQYEIEKNKSELKSVLSSRGLSAEFADLIQISEDLEESQARIDTLDRLFKQAVAEEVKRRLATGKPTVGTGSADELSREKFKKMSLTERNELYRDNPELYNKLKH
jgi:hypothetical protein